eukprot:355717-Chlamydomonas_euryale.AAC.4
MPLVLRGSPQVRVQAHWHRRGGPAQRGVYPVHLLHGAGVRPGRVTQGAAARPRGQLYCACARTRVCGAIGGDDGGGGGTARTEWMLLHIPTGNYVVRMRAQAPVGCLTGTRRGGSGTARREGLLLRILVGNYVVRMRAQERAWGDLMGTRRGGGERWWRAAAHPCGHLCCARARPCAHVLSNRDEEGGGARVPGGNKADAWEASPQVCGLGAQRIPKSCVLCA